MDKAVRWIRLIGACLCLAAPAAFAAPVAPVNPEATIAQAGAELHAAAAGVNTKALGDAEIEARLASLGPVQARLDAVLQSLVPRLSVVRALRSPMKRGRRSRDSRIASSSAPGSGVLECRSGRSRIASILW